MTDQEMIEAWLQHEGYKAQEWGTDDDDDIFASLGRWRVIEEDEDRGLYNKDEGVVRIAIVGAEKYNNRRVHIGFLADDTDCPIDTTLDHLEPID